MSKVRVKVKGQGQISGVQRLIFWGKASKLMVPTMAIWRPSDIVGPLGMLRFCPLLKGAVGAILRPE